MAVTIGSLLIKLGLDSGAFKSGLGQSERELRKSVRKIEGIGKSLQGIGTKLSIGVSAPLIALGKASVDGFVAQEKAMADVNAALKSMGNASGKTAGELLKTSDALELHSLYDGDVILKQVTANLLTFGNVAGKEFDRAQQAALDMATRLGGEPQQAAIQLGKALNDPVKGITALTRVGVQFTEKQQDAIKALVKTGDVAGAQGIILAEVERQFKGAAAAAADASPWRQAQVAIGQAGDAIGAAILPIIKPVGEAIASIARAFASLPEPVQKFVVVAGILAAALGPVLIGIGSLVTTFAPFLASAAAGEGILLSLSGAAGSLAAVLVRLSPLALAAYVVWENWDEIAPRLQPLIDQLTAIGEGLGLVKGESGRTAEELAKNEGWRTFGANVAATGQKIADFVDGANTAGLAVHAFVADLLSNFANLAKSAGQYMDNLAAGIHRALIGKLNAVWATVKAKIDAVKGFFFDLYDAVVGHSYVPDMVDGIAAEMNRLDAVMVAPAKKAASAVTEAMRDMAQRTQALLDRLFPEVRQLLDYRKDLATLDAAKLSPEIDAAARGRLARQVTGSEGDVPLGTQDPGPLFSVDLSAVQAGLEKAIGLTDKLKAGWSSLKEIGAAAFGEVSHQLTGVILGAQKLGDALRNVVAHLAEMALNAAFKALGASIGIPGFATGTSFAPGGLAMVGERGPELVNLPRGSRVYPANDTAQMLAGNDNRPINISIYGAHDERQARATAGILSRRLRRELNGQ